MIQAIVLDFLDVILLPRSAVDAQQETMEDPTGLYRVNTILLARCKTVQEEQGIPVFLFTASAPQEYEWLGQEIAWVTGVYTSWKMGWHKGSRECYVALAGEVHTPASEMVFIDNTLYNIAAAQEAGWETIHFKNNKETFTQLEALL
ncbi:MAG: hypothetical protein COU33_01805 [Candidatus Magasanikbacteria bacterium CG10_big_fil_rev_8_21_14_0_10_43_6]|uniref:Uncharacterized protein n=1 Tax=Candidatus Magasanikbacteria bacterium CG10_big_fil_rev_8_21_14_0_10_43_6 TaxID=1974650 RepID=A0A2M6W1L1_9BACT|nr:MAG: hypothetical protein COU33_01805 [Candidatus Magasanikbacteria bacterium CG10_big_fil_rev_8_21_14_0_10_43_6]